MTAIAALAREIGADFQPHHESVLTLGLYSYELAYRLLGSIAPKSQANPAAGALTAIFCRSIHQPALLELQPLLLLAANDVGRIITTLDDDDGWPVCPWLHALTGCTLALRFGLEAAYSTRWPAQAGLQVVAVVLGHTRDQHQPGPAMRDLRLAFCREVYGRAAPRTPVKA